MATAVSKPSPHPPKMKRPPPPFPQTGPNGVKPQQALSSSPTITQEPLTQGSHVVAQQKVGNDGLNSSSNANGASNRVKTHAQRGDETASRKTRAATRNPSAPTQTWSPSSGAGPYVKTTSYILKKYAKSPPSLILHLHPTHFRFDQQDGSFPYNSEMKVILEHIRAGTIPHEIIEELLRGGVRFYEGCLIVRVVDHKSVSAQAQKTSVSTTTETNSPYSLHNYNEHITPSAFVPYPKQTQLNADSQSSKSSQDSGAVFNHLGHQKGEDKAEAPKDTTSSKEKDTSTKPRVFTTVLHPTPRVLQAELTLFVTTPDPQAAPLNQNSHLQSSSTVPQSPTVAQPDRGNAQKRQKTLVEPQDLVECESMLVNSLAPQLYLGLANNFEETQALLKFLRSPLHNDPPPSPKRRKRTVAELAADEALAAEEERFMLIMDERLPNSSSAPGASKATTVDETSGVAPFEPRFSRFKTLETIRMQHEEKAKQEHELKLKQEIAKRQQQEQEKERRRVLEIQQAEQHAKDEARRQQLAAQQAQAQLAAQNRHAMAQPNGVSQAQQSSPVVRQQTPHSISSPLVGSAMAGQAPAMSISASQQSGSPPRPPSSLQHPHPNMMSHPMSASRSQQGPSRHSTPQMAQATPAMSQATPIIRNVTPTQRMNQGSPVGTMAQAPMMNPSMSQNSLMNGAPMGLTPQQQQMLLQRQLLAQQQGGQMGSMSQLTPQQLAQLQANAHATQNIKSAQQQQQLLQAQQAQNQQHQAQSNMPTMPQHNHQAYQAQLRRAQLAQMQMVKQQGQMQQGQTNQQQPQQQQMQLQQQLQQLSHQGSPQMTAQQQQQQQQQMLMAAAQANGGQVPTAQNANMVRYNRLYQNRLMTLRQEMSQRLMAQYGPPNQYPPQLAQQYTAGLEKNAKAWIADLMRRDREAFTQQRAQALAMQNQQMQQQNMMHNGMGN
ncbi:Uncharacterized protein PECH_007434 [Penicillium ucsense]|uniref:Spt20-like SEP domain-containing protein n=1 Tax=Penicillium ucsense TaxID=2839758 RepID=A0A8J8WDL7_9EURO|nr:Uncharacterized protein PECM_000060 [Penicillium ucsense]KAF7734892.1 Uncharacterized protein PECH_007434 [Penicillium ucsense]